MELSKLHSPCPKDYFKEKNFKTYSFLNQFRSLSESFEDFRQKKFGNLVKTTIYVSRYIVLGNFFGNSIINLSSFRAKNFRTFGEKSSPWSSKLRFTCLNKNFEELQKVLEKLYSFYQFHFLSKNLRTFGKQFSAGWLKLHSMYPEEIFWNFE